MVSYTFPPVGGAGVQRVTKWLKYLPSLGWKASVLTTENPSVPVTDASLSADVPTETIVDVSELAEQAYQREFPQIVARAVVRRVLKKAAVYQTKEFVSVHSPILEFAFDLVGVAWEASESADTRCWGLLPDRIQIARLELPAGEHSVRLQPSTISRFTPPPGTWTMEKVDVLIHDGQNTYLLANFPGEKLVGQIVTSN